MPKTDPRLERLYDYTKFHIGIYITAAGVMLTIASSDQMREALGLSGYPVPFLMAILAMALAGMCGGIIATNCITSSSFDEVWERRIGPWDRKLLTGRYWARAEHGAFWLSAILIASAVLHPFS